jgi:hypothetical protein
MMNKRSFLNVAALGGLVGVAGHAGAQGAPKSLRGPVLLTVSGAIGKGNRGPLDPALDQMMRKQKISFDKAQVFDFATLAAMPAVVIRPTLEYDNKPHTLKGPLLLDVLKASGAQPGDKATVLLRAVDGYAAAVTLADLRKYRFIVATHIDGQPMTLGGLGPLWAVYDADRFPDMAAKPVTERFGFCPWATYHIEVKQA